MATSTVEDYLKTILVLQQALDDGKLVTMGQIGSALGVAPGTVTAMVKTLEKGGLVVYEPYSGVRLTPRRAANGPRRLAPSSPDRALLGGDLGARLV